MSSAFVPELDLHLGEQSEEECYNEERFIDLLRSLAQRSILYYLPYDEPTLKGFYQQILLREQVPVMSMEVMHQFISELKQRNRRELAIENDYYQQAIRGHLEKGISTISKREFKKIMDRYEGELPIITEILMESSRQAEFIGCELVLQLLKQVSLEVEDAVIPELTITKLKTLRVDREGSEEGGRESVQPIFEQIGQFQVKRLLQQCFRLAQRKICLYRQFIADQEMVEDSQQFEQQLLQFHSQLSEQIQQMIDTNTQLSTHCEQFNQMYQHFQEEQALQGEIHDQLRQEIEQLKGDLKASQAKSEQLQVVGAELEGGVRSAQEEMVRIGKYCEEVEGELQRYKRSYKQIYEEYQKLVQSNTKKSVLVREEEAKKIFASRSIKEQLDDTAHKLNKVLAQREKERSAYRENEEKNSNIIDMLEGRVEELQRELQQKNEYLSDYMRESKLFNSRSAFRISAIIPKDGNFPKEEKQAPEVSRHSVQSTYSRISTKPNPPRANLAALQPIEEEEGELQDLNKRYEQQNVLKVIRQDGQVGSQEAFKKNKAQNGQKSFISGVTGSQKCCFCRATIINIYGKKFETMILITSRRFCYFDTKARLEKYLPLDKIKEIIFNVDNPNSFVIKPHKDISKDYINNDMIFTTRSLSRFMKTVHLLKSEGSLKANVTIKKGENTWIKVGGNEYNLKLSIPNNHNPYRLALAPQNVFYGQVKEEGIFTSKIDAVIIIQPIGILCFQGEQTYEIEVNRTFVCLLPIVDEMRIVDKKNSKEAPDKKLIIEYIAKGCEFSYSIIFPSIQQTKRFRKIVQGELKRQQQVRDETKARVMKMFPN